MEQMKNGEGVTEELKAKDQTDSDKLYEKFASMLTANERACNLAYLVGAKNTIQFLSEANALKGNVGI